MIIKVMVIKRIVENAKLISQT